MTEEVKDWIRLNLDLIDSEEYTRFLTKGYQELDYLEFLELLKFFDTNEFFDTTQPKLEVFTNVLMDRIKYYQSRPKWEDPSNSWSRLQYCISEIGSFRLKYVQIVDYLNSNQSKLGLKLGLLPPGYGWESSDDFDLGWFDKDKFYALHAAEIDGDY